MADRIGVDRRTIAAIEAGDPGVSLGNAPNATDILRVPLVALRTTRTVRPAEADAQRIGRRCCRGACALAQPEISEDLSGLLRYVLRCGERA
ncbi:MAG: hypothetical protein ACRCYU_12705 [Nocardioides sp.]